MAAMLRTRQEWQSHGADLERELAEAKAQLDRLVEALNKIADLCQMTCMTFETQSFKATEIAIEALAAVTHT
jgi:hypothetical protein